MIDWKDWAKRLRSLLGRKKNSDLSSNNIESYNLLALRLATDLEVSEGGRSLMVVAVGDDSAAIETITELAWCLAEDLGHSVLIADGTIELGLLTDAFGARELPGIAELLADGEIGPESLNAILAPTQHASVKLLPCGVGKHKQATVRTEDLNRLVRAASASFDYILILGSSLASPNRSVAFTNHVDAALLVAVDGMSMIHEIQAGQQVLNELGADQVALILLTPATDQHAPK